MEDDECVSGKLGCVSFARCGDRVAMQTVKTTTHATNQRVQVPFGVKHRHLASDTQDAGE